MTAMDAYNNLATWQVLARWRDTGAIADETIFSDRRDAQHFANSYPSRTYAVSIYAGNDAAMAIEAMENNEIASMSDDELLAELGL